MASDSLFDEMEPRVQRPFLPFLPDRGLRMPPQVSEPSLYGDDILSPFKQVFQPRATITQTSPVKSPGFIPQLTPISVLKKSNRSIDTCVPKTPMCGCKSSPLNATTNSSPSIDPEIKELIQDQNRQLSLLQKQVEQLLSYQEKLQDKLGEKEKANGSTQTSYFEVQSPNPNPSPVRVFPRSNSGSPLMRQAQDRTEITLTFRDLQLETIVEQPPSPQQSFVVNMQEYQESVSEQSDESMVDSCGNVMEHVQKLLAQANIVDSRRALMEKPPERLVVQNVMPERQGMVFVHNAAQENPIRKVTMQRVQELGISFINPFPASVPRNLMYYPRCSTKSSHTWDTRKETDQSVEMQRLAEKYLGQTKPIENNKQPDSTFKNLNSRSVEMSMSSQQYLERYGLQEDLEYSTR